MKIRFVETVIYLISFFRRLVDRFNDRYYITRKKYRTVNGKGFFEYTLSYAQEGIAEVKFHSYLTRYNF